VQELGIGDPDPGQIPNAQPESIGPSVPKQDSLFTIPFDVFLAALRDR
jgi:hypothetical protein